MKQYRVAGAFVGLIFLAACAPSAVNQGIDTANAACQKLVPAGESTAQSTFKGGAANTAAAISSGVNDACQGVAQAAANESAIDAGVSVLDSWWEKLFGPNAPATAAVTPAPAVSAPAPAPSAPAVDLVDNKFGDGAASTPAPAASTPAPAASTPTS